MVKQRFSDSKQHISWSNFPVINAVCFFLLMLAGYALYTVKTGLRHVFSALTGKRKPDQESDSRAAGDLSHINADSVSENRQRTSARSDAAGADSGEKAVDRDTV